MFYRTVCESIKSTRQKFKSSRIYQRIKHRLKGTNKYILVAMGSRQLRHLVMFKIDDKYVLGEQITRYKILKSHYFKITNLLMLNKIKPVMEPKIYKIKVFVSKIKALIDLIILKIKALIEWMRIEIKNLIEAMLYQSKISTQITTVPAGVKRGICYHCLYTIYKIYKISQILCKLFYFLFRNLCHLIYRGIIFGELWFINQIRNQYWLRLWNNAEKVIVDKVLSFLLIWESFWTKKTIQLLKKSEDFDINNQKVFLAFSKFFIEKKRSFNKHFIKKSTRSKIWVRSRKNLFIPGLDMTKLPKKISIRDYLSLKSLIECLIEEFKASSPVTIFKSFLNYLKHLIHSNRQFVYSFLRNRIVRIGIIYFFPFIVCLCNAVFLYHISPMSRTMGGRGDKRLPWLTPFGLKLFEITQIRHLLELLLRCYGLAGSAVVQIYLMQFYSFIVPPNYKHWNGATFWGDLSYHTAFNLTLASYFINVNFYSSYAYYFKDLVAYVVVAVRHLLMYLPLKNFCYRVVNLYRQSFSVWHEDIEDVFLRALAHYSNLEAYLKDTRLIKKWIRYEEIKAYRAIKYDAPILTAQLFQSNINLVLFWILLYNCFYVALYNKNPDLYFLTGTARTYLQRRF